MPAHAAHETVQITIDGVKYQVSPGFTSLSDLIKVTKINAKTAKLTVGTAAPVQASSIKGNDSYNIIGGEVMTSTVGA